MQSSLSYNMCLHCQILPSNLLQNLVVNFLQTQIWQSINTYLIPSNDWHIKPAWWHAVKFVFEAGVQLKIETNLKDKIDSLS